MIGRAGEALSEERPQRRRTGSGGPSHEHRYLAAPLRAWRRRGLAGTTLGALGFGDVESAYASSIRAWKLAGTTETRNTCTYCAVGCGIIMYSKGNVRRVRRPRSFISKAIRIIRPIAARCARRAPALLEFVHLQDPHDLSANPQARVRQVRARILGLCARPRRAADEGRPRQELHRQERRRRDGQPLADAPASWRPRRPATKRRA